VDAQTRPAAAKLIVRASKYDFNSLEWELSQHGRAHDARFARHVHVQLLRMTTSRKKTITVTNTNTITNTITLLGRQIKH
jgi:hypothetical protein